MCSDNPHYLFKYIFGICLGSMLIFLSNSSHMLQNSQFPVFNLFGLPFCYHSNGESQINTRCLYFGYCSNKLIRIKKQQKEERKQQWQKEQAQKEKEQTEKAKQAEKNPYSVFAEKDDEEVCMEEESVVFTDSSSSDHLPKGTLPRLPVTK